MNWPLPYISLNSNMGVTWLTEFLGKDSKFVELSEGIKINGNAVAFEDKLYLTFGTTPTPDFDTQFLHEHAKRQKIDSEK